MTIRRALAAVSVLAAAAACGTDGGDPTSAPVTSAPVTGEITTSQEPAATNGPPAFPEVTTRQQAQGSGPGGLVLTDVRVAGHDGFERIVLQFTGRGRPGWVVNYVDKAVLDGSGRVVKLDGDAILDIYATGTTWPAPDYYSGPRQLEPKNGDVAAVHVGGTFEGDTQVLVGIDGDPVPFRVFALTNPSRLVVDVVDNSSG